MLTSVLDADITKRIVRLGGRSKDERISQFSLRKLEEVQGRSERLDHAFKGQYRQLRDVERKMDAVLKKLQKRSIESAEMEEYLEFSFPERYEDLINLPVWVRWIRCDVGADTERHGVWRQATGGQRSREADTSSESSFWCHTLCTVFNPLSDFRSLWVLERRS
jgi:hypothetical protein